MNTVIKVMESLVALNNWKVTRFDIQHYKYGDNIEGYAGYLSVEDIDNTLIIRNDGSFEYSSTR